MVTNIDGFNSNDMEGFEFKASITQEVKLNPIHHKSQFFTVVQCHGAVNLGPQIGSLLLHARIF